MKSLHEGLGTNAYSELLQAGRVPAIPLAGHSMSHQFSFTSRLDLCWHQSSRIRATQSAGARSQWAKPGHSTPDLSFVDRTFRLSAGTSPMNHMAVPKADSRQQSFFLGQVLTLVPRLSLNS
jgi:hypothetical protein